MEGVPLAPAAILFWQAIFEALFAKLIEDGACLATAQYFVCFCYADEVFYWKGLISFLIN